MAAIIIAAAAFAVQAVLTTGQSCTPRYQALINAPGGDIPPQDAGIWYMYRANGAVTLNQQINITSFGPTVEPLTNTSGAGQYMQIAWSTPNTGQCVNEYWTGVYANNGMQVGFDAVTTDTINRLKAYSVLYHEYQKIMIGYGCYKPKQDGTCAAADAMIWAQTRTRPDQLSASDMASFDGIINSTFQQYCITTQNLPKQTYDASKAMCPFVSPPSCINGLISGTALTLPGPGSTSNGQATTASSQPGSYGSTGSSNSGSNGCKWPIYIAPKITYDTTKIGGIAWVYRQLFPLKAASVHGRYFRHVLGTSMLPLTNLTGNFEWLEFIQYDSPDTPQCSRGSWAGFAATNGQSVGLSFVATPTGDIQVNSRVVTLYYDSQYEVYYACNTPGVQTGFCDSPFVIVVGHNDPSQWSQSEKTRIDNDIINPLFKPYGCSVNDIPAMTFPSNKPPCDFLGSPPCLNQYIAGFNEITGSTTAGNGGY